VAYSKARRLANLASTSHGIADDQVTTASIADDAITSALIADDAVTSALVADDAVVQAAIADDAVDEARLQISNAGSNGQFLTKQSGNTGGLTWASSTGASLTVGAGAAEDTKVIFDGNAQDFYVGLDDSADDLVIGLGSAVGTTPAIHIDENQVVTFDAGVSEEYTAVASSSNATAIDCRVGNTFAHTLTENTTFTFSNPAASGKTTIFLLKLIQDSTARTVTWPNSVDWAAATAPTITTTNAGVDIFVFMTHDGGTIWYGFTAGQALG